MGIPGAADNVNGSLAWLAQHNPAEFGFAVTDGNWTVRNDVFVWTNEVKICSFQHLLMCRTKIYCMRSAELLK